MDKDELEQYEYQLSQIDIALLKDPTNAEYLNLKEELTSLIDLTKEYLASVAPAPILPSSTAAAATTTNHHPVASTSAASTSKSSHSHSHSTTTSSTSSVAPPAPAPATVLKPGDECNARYSGDNKFYPAQILSVGNGGEFYSVIFPTYGKESEIVQRGDIKVLSAGERKRRGGGGGAVTIEEEREKEVVDPEKERKKRKLEKKKETREKKVVEQEGKQSAWMSFAKKSSKKGTANIPGFSGESMFRSPADGQPQAKVGVVGSGRAMTAAVSKVRQTFREE